MRLKGWEEVNWKTVKPQNRARATKRGRGLVPVISPVTQQRCPKYLVDIKNVHKELEVVTAFLFLRPFFG